jgi:hypothetical protein
MGAYLTAGAKVYPKAEDLVHDLGAIWADFARREAFGYG